MDFDKIPKHLIKGFPDYGFIEDRRLYNYRTKRFINIVKNNYSLGYILDGKFITEKKVEELKELFYKRTPEYDYDPLSNLPKQNKT